MFIRNYLEESLQFVKETYKDIDVKVYNSKLKKYALELFLKQCEYAMPDKEKNSEDYNIGKQNLENKEFFNYVYDNLKYPE